MLVEARPTITPSCRDMYHQHCIPLARLEDLSSTHSNARAWRHFHHVSSLAVVGGLGLWLPGGGMHAVRVGVDGQRDRV